MAALRISAGAAWMRDIVLIVITGLSSLMMSSWYCGLFLFVRSYHFRFKSKYGNISLPIFFAISSNLSPPPAAAAKSIDA